MIDILSTCADKGQVFAVVTSGHPVPGLPGLFLIDPLHPIDSHDEKHGVEVVHGASGKRVTKAENGDIMARRMRRLQAVTLVFGIDWSKRAPTRKTGRQANAVRWALDPVAAMFGAPCPDAIETCMTSPVKPPDHVVTTLLG